MSAPTVLFVLAKAIAQGLPKPDCALGHGTGLHRIMRVSPPGSMTMEAASDPEVVTLQRPGELVLSSQYKDASGQGHAGKRRRSLPAHGRTPRQLARGIVVAGSGAVPSIAGFLIAYLAVQPLRIWILATLEGRWTTRIVILPNSPWLGTDRMR